LTEYFLDCVLSLCFKTELSIMVDLILSSHTYYVTSLYRLHSCLHTCLHTYLHTCLHTFLQFCLQTVYILVYKLLYILIYILDYGTYLFTYLFPNMFKYLSLYHLTCRARLSIFTIWSWKTSVTSVSLLITITNRKQTA